MTLGPCKNPANGTHNHRATTAAAPVQSILSKATSRHHGGLCNRGVLRQRQWDAHLLTRVEDLGKLHHALAATTALYRREELVAVIEGGLHAAHRIQRHLQRGRR